MNTNSNTEYNFSSFNDVTNCGVGFVAVSDTYWCPLHFLYWYVGMLELTLTLVIQFVKDYMLYAKYFQKYDNNVFCSMEVACNKNSY